jgi:hypothetical protein
MWFNDQCHHIIIKKKHLFKQQIQEEEQFFLPVASLYKQNSCLNEQYNPRKCPKRRFTCRYQLYQQIVDAKRGE